MKLTIESVTQAIENNNGKIAPAARELGAQYQAVRYWVKHHNIPYNDGRIKASPEYVKKLYSKLGSLSLVAKELGCTKDGVRHFMIRNKLKINKLVIHDVNHDFFKEENERTLYWAGFIAADGCVKAIKRSKTGCSYELGIGLASKDHDHLEKFKADIGYTGPIGRYIVKNSKQNPKWNDSEKSDMSITSRTIFDDLAKYNIVPRKTLTYTFPQHLVDHPLVNHFMRGYFDGDGSWYFSQQKNKAEQLYFNLRGTDDMLINFRDILQRDAFLKDRPKNVRQNCGIGSLEYGGNGVSREIADFLYKDATVFMDRKMDKAYKY